MVRLVVLDMDGTVLKKGEKCISDENTELLNSIHSSGYLVCIASGRSCHELLRLCEPLDFEPIFAASDGACVYIDGAEALAKPIGKNDILCMFNYFKDLLFAGAELSGRYVSYVCGSDDFLTFMIKQRQNQVKRVFAANEINGDVYKITLFLKSGESYAEAFVKKILPSGLRIVYSGEKEIEIVRCDADKKSAADKLRELLLKRGDAVFAAGDGENDFSLLCAAEVSAAMESAPLHIKNICTHTIKNLSEIKKILNIE